MFVGLVVQARKQAVGGLYKAREMFCIFVLYMHSTVIRLKDTLYLSVSVFNIYIDNDCTN